MDTLLQKMGIKSQSSIAIPAPGLRYGAAETLRSYGRVSVVVPQSSRKFKFFLGEFTGLLFIALTTLYVFLMPAELARPGELRGALNRTLKRAIDITGAVVGLVLSAPLMLLVGLAVKLGSPGPVFYTQQRVGVNRRKRDRRYCRQIGAEARRQRDRRREDYLGRPFQMIKFRTMIHNAEKGTGPVWAVRNDPRITRLGMFLRKTRLDEIPQFWSILIGDMSLVGPRPERPSFVRDLCTKVEDYHHRLDVKPGLTGLAQVENGYDSDVASVVEKVRFDLKYIRGWSVWFDVRIMLKTVVVVVTGRGAC